MRSSVHNWCETTGCREFKSEAGSCCPKDRIYPTLMTKKWLQKPTADHKEGFLPVCEKEINETKDKGEILVLKWNFSRCYGVKRAILAVPWKVRMAAVSEGETEGVVALTAQIALQQWIHISSENSKGRKLHPSSLPHSIPAPLLCSNSHFPWWEQPGPGLSFSFLGWCPSTLHRLQWISPMFPSRISHLQAAPALLRGLGAAGPFLPCLCPGIMGILWKSHLSIFVFLHLYLRRKSILLFVAKLSDSFWC